MGLAITIVWLFGFVVSTSVTIVIATFRSKRFRAWLTENFASTRYLHHPTLPGPPVLPFVGSFVSSLDALEASDAHLLNERVLVEHSKGGLLLIQNSFFGHTVIGTGDAEVAKLLLAKGKRTGGIQANAEDLCKYGLFLMPTDGVWRTHRKRLQPAFGPSHLRHAFSASNDVAIHLINGIKQQWKEEQAKGSSRLVLEVHRYLASWTIDVLSRVAFSSDFRALPYLFESGGISPAFKNLETLMDIVVKRNIIPKMVWGLAGISPAKVDLHRRQTHDHIENLLAQRLKMWDEVRNQLDARDLDVMDRLVARDEDGQERFSKREIVDELIAFMLAGQETTANTMTWFLLELSRHPEFASEIEQEVDEVWRLYSPNPDGPTLSGSSITFETLVSNCPKLDAFMKEVMRFHPVVTGVSRTLEDGEVVLAGHTIPVGPRTSFYVDIRAMHFNELYWKDPKTFNPRRWQDAPVPGSFLPFADGPHICIGKKMAVIEAMTLMAILVRNFRFSLVPGQNLQGQTAITTGLRNGLFLEIEARAK
ncbi:cytochrome P450 [Cladochytrium replicatum]|nr:cytochrome P450 [Cladochytrium replicatum]